MCLHCLGCGASITLHGAQSITFQSENFDSDSPSVSPCNYSVTVPPYHNTIVNINKLQLNSDSCETSALEVSTCIYHFIIYPCVLQ